MELGSSNVYGNIPKALKDFAVVIICSDDKATVYETIERECKKLGHSMVGRQVEEDRSRFSFEITWDRKVGRGGAVGTIVCSEKRRKDDIWVNITGWVYDFITRMMTDTAIIFQYH